VRAELVLAYDQFEPTDLGRCGEPYAPNPVCNKTLGLFIHGLTGFAIAGETRPPNPWNSWKGIEVGGRLEWRWDRFSFALSDYWGYTDLPYQKTLFRYSRNVDPRTGRPRWGMSTGSCRTGREASCLTENNALTHHSVNQQLFMMICSTSIGFSQLDTSACGQTVFNSRNLTDPADPLRPRVMVALTNIVSGQNTGPLATPSFFFNGQTVFEGLGEFTETTLRELDKFEYIIRDVSINFPALGAVPTPLVPLVADVNDGDPFDVTGTEWAGDTTVSNRRHRPDERRGQRDHAVLPGLSGHLGRFLGHAVDPRRPGRHGGLPGRSGVHALRGWQDLHPAGLPGAG
jgi:hypothetical protein